MSRITRWRVVMAGLLCASTPVAAQDAKQIDSLYVARDSAALEHAIAGALKAHPQDAMIHFSVQRIRLEQERYAEAVASGRTVVERADPSLAGMRGWAGVRMGIAAFMLDDGATAGEALRGAAALVQGGRPARVAADLLRLLALDTAYAAWQTHETEHFRVHLPPGSPVTDPRVWAGEREAAFARMQTFFQVVLPKKIDMVVWSDSLSAARMGYPALGFAQPPFAVVHTLPNQTPGHEPAHIVAWLAGDKPGNALRTRIISDGTSVHFDGAPRDRLALARRGLAAAPGFTVSIPAMWDTGGNAPAAVLYPVSGLFVQRLIDRGGRERFMALLRDQRLENARAIYGPLLDEVIASVEKDVNAR